MKINNLSVHRRAIYRIIYANAIGNQGGRYPCAGGSALHGGLPAPPGAGAAGADRGGAAAGGGGATGAEHRANVDYKQSSVGLLNLEVQPGLLDNAQGLYLEQRSKPTGFVNPGE